MTQKIGSRERERERERERGGGGGGGVESHRIQRVRKDERREE